MAKNGQLDTDNLVDIGGGRYLNPDAAASWQEMYNAAKEAGVNLGVTDAYRTYDQQVTCAKTKGISGRGGTCAVPGTSNHGWGKALDINNGKGIIGANSPQYKWLTKNADKYGWGGISNETWHWEYRGDTGGKKTSINDVTAANLPGTGSVSGGNDVGGSGSGVDTTSTAGIAKASRGGSFTSGMDWASASPTLTSRIV